MCITCPDCGKELNNISVHKFNQDYLEGFVSQYFNRPMSHILSISEFKRDRHFKAVFFYLLRKWGKVTINQLSAKYRLHPNRILEYANSVHNQSGDIKVIERLLQVA